ncbi:retrovirus-related pol polyprotein from transposon TNT 1-94 [Tanacetum coccineum]
MLHPKPIHYTTSPWETPYELLHDRKPNLSYLHIFCALCYPNNDSENLGKLQAKADIGIFIGYAPKKKVYRIYNQRTRKIIETIHVDFDELTTMASKQSSLEPALHEMTPATLMFDEFFSPPASVASLVYVEEALVPVESTGSPSSTTVDQDAPSPKTISEESSSLDVISTTVHSDALISEHLTMQEELHEFERLEVWELVFRPDKVMVWKSVRYGVSKDLDMAYWGFLGVRTTLDIFQNIIFKPYLEYGVLSLSGYGVLSFILCGLW